MSLVDDEILKPVEWIETLIPNTSEVMYVNVRTKQCASQLPKGQVSKTLDGDQWWELCERSSGRIYYYNVNTKQRSWKRPASCAIGQLVPMTRLQIALKPEEQPSEYESQSSSNESTYQEPHRPSRVMRPVRKLSRPPTVRLVKQASRNKKKQVTTIDDLPDEMLSIVLQSLPMQQNSTLERVCSRWKNQILSFPQRLLTFDSSTASNQKQAFNDLPHLLGKFGAGIKTIDFAKLAIQIEPSQVRFVSETCPQLAVIRAPSCNLPLCELPRFGSLRRLSFYGDTGVYVPELIRDQITSIFNYQLTDIQIYGCNTVPSWLLDAIESPAVSLLHQLELKKPHREQASDVLRRCPKIRSFKLKFSHDDNGELLSPLRQLHSLQSLSLKGCALTYFSALGDVAQSSPWLEILNLTRTVGNRDFSFLRQLSNLKQLIVPETSFFPLDVQDINHKAPLETLNISHTAAASQAGIEILAQHPLCATLKHLLCDGNMGVKSIEPVLGVCPGLQTLSVYNQQSLRDQILSQLLEGGTKLLQVNIKHTGCSMSSFKKFVKVRKSRIVTPPTGYGLPWLSVCCDHKIPQKLTASARL